MWSAIAYLQRTQPDVVSMVYTGDVSPGAADEGKAKIINDVKVSRRNRTFPYLDGADASRPASRSRSTPLHSISYPFPRGISSPTATIGVSPCSCSHSAVCTSLGKVFAARKACGAISFLVGPAKSGIAVS